MNNTIKDHDLLKSRLNFIDITFNRFFSEIDTSVYAISKALKHKDIILYQLKLREISIIESDNTQVAFENRSEVYNWINDFINNL